MFYGYLLYYIGLKYILKSTCYLWNTHISMKSYQLNHITYFNSSNSSCHFKLMGCSSLPWPHRYRHKSQNEPVTKVTTIHFTPERSSPPVFYRCSIHAIWITTWSQLWHGDRVKNVRKILSQKYSAEMFVELCYIPSHSNTGTRHWQQEQSVTA